MMISFFKRGRYMFKKALRMLVIFCVSLMISVGYLWGKATGLAYGGNTAIQIVHFEIRPVNGIVPTGAVNENSLPPAGAVLINEDQKITKTQGVALKINSADSARGVSQMCVSNDSSESCARWEPYKRTKHWTLTPGNGLKLVCVRTKDASGDVSTPVCDYILLLE
jgi:hypothetical protein